MTTKEEKHIATARAADDDWPAYVSETHARIPQIAGKPSPNGISGLKVGAPATNASQPKPIPFSAKPNLFPGIFARSGLFGVARLTHPLHDLASSIGIKAQGAYSIEFEGIPLTMNDKLVYESVIRIAKNSNHDLMEPLKTSLREIGQQMGWTALGGRNLAWIRDSLDRLVRASLNYRLLDGVPRQGQLLLNVEKAMGGVAVSFDPPFVLAAFGLDKQFAIDSSKRSTLGSPLTQWLHDFISTHSTAIPLSMKYLRELCGFDARRKSFPSLVESALEQLIASAPELVVSYSIDKPTKGSDLWLIHYVRGAQAPNFIDPSKSGKQKTTTASKPKKPASGLAL